MSTSILTVQLKTIFCYIYSQHFHLTLFDTICHGSASLQVDVMNNSHLGLFRAV